MKKQTADIVVIGGGIAGASTAYRLVEKGYRVILLEKGRVGEQASGRAGGGVRQQNRHPAELPLAMAAIEIWADLADELECEVDYRRFGNLRLLFTREEYETYAKIAAREQEMGLSVEMISPAALRELAPALSNELEIVGAKYCASDGTANPLRVVKAICRKARKMGLNIKEDEAVHGIRVEDGKQAEED